MNRLPATARSAEIHAHKLFAPHAASSVPRSRMLQRVFDDDRPRVVFLQAPAGHGKSTLLQQIKDRSESDGVLIGWLSFDEADNDALRFSAHLAALIAALEGTGRSGAASVEVLGDAGLRYRSDWLIDRLTALREPVDLFFDEFQTLTDRAILAFWRDLLARGPAHVRFFIGSRSLPEIGLARLVVASEALVVRAEDLRFSAEETRSFFALARTSRLSGDEIDAIHRCTEGWPAAVQLFRLSLTSEPAWRSLSDMSSYRPRELAEYLAENVLALQPPHVRDFLLRSALLERMTAPLCHRISGRHDSQQMLLELERGGLFMQCLDAERRWFRYHGLFRTIIAEQFTAREPETANRIHREAACWLIEHGEYEDALRHASEAGDFALAADALDTWSSRLIVRGHMITVERWYDRLPFDEVATRPKLLIKIAWALVFMRRRHKLQAVIRELQRRRDTAGPAAHTDSEIVLAVAAMCADDIHHAFAGIERVQISDYQALDFGAFELAAGANMHAYRALIVGEFAAAHEYLNKARAYNALGGAPFSGGYTYCFAGVGLLVTGRLPQALQCFHTGLEEQRALLDRSCVSAALAACYVWALYESDELDAADSVFEEYHEVMAESAVPDLFAVGYLAMARAHDARGYRELAAEIREEAERIATINGWPRIVGIVQWERVRRSLLAGEPGRARAIAAKLPSNEPPLPTTWVPFSDELQNAIFGRALLEIRTGDTRIAAELIANAQASSTDRVYRQIKLHLLEAQLHDCRGARDRAQRSLRQALKLAEQGCYVRAFIDDGERMVKLLTEALDAEDSRSFERHHFIDRLLAAAALPSRLMRTAADADRMKQFTVREREILEMLAAGISNREVGNALFISENTVKFHLKKIYAKLGVNRRLQAIVAGRERGLIE